MRTFRKVSVLCAALCFALLAAENTLVEKPDPETAGMSAGRLARIAPRMKEFVDSGKAAGIVTLVARHGHIASLDAVGYQNLESGTAMKTDSIFRIMSVTKPITCAGVMVLVDEGRLSVLDPVEKFIPEFKGIRVNPCGTRNGFDCQLAPAQRPFTVLDLMTHTSGLGDAGGGRGGAAPTSRAESIAMSAQRMNLIFQPGAAWSYSNFGIGVLGRVIEVASGRSFDDFMAERIFSPLGMKDTSFQVPAAKAGRVATVYTTMENGKLAPLDPARIQSGGISSPDSGLLSTARDLARFLQMMLNKGTLDGQTVLSAAAVETMTSSQTGTLPAGYAPGTGQGLGFEIVREPLGSFRYASIGTFEKAGVYRTYVWGDPAKDLLGVILMQRNTGGYQADMADEVNAFMAMAAAAVAK